MADHLNERGESLLRLLVERYIEDGQPVGSRTLAKALDLKLSPATIRNVMSDLEELGYLHSPHTSAGRVPTSQGFRFFVDSLLNVGSSVVNETRQIEHTVAETDDPQLLVQSISSALSELTQMAGIVTVPRKELTSIRHIEFLPLGGKRVLAVLVFNDQEIQNSVLETDREYSRAELERASNYISASLVGRSLGDIREMLVSSMKEAKDGMNKLMADAVTAAEKVASKRDEDFVLSGETNLMGFDDLSDLEQLRGLFDAFHEKNQILHLLDRCIYADGVQIFIGEESRLNNFDGVSLVTSPYSMDGEVLGVLGVIGPTRMNYKKVIPLVDITAKLLGSALNPRH